MSKPIHRPPYRCLEERLLANSVYDPETGCREWIGSVNNRGYPRLTMRVPDKPFPVPIYAHRAMFELRYERAIEPGHTLDHKCENTRCIEPEHMEEVLDDENTRRRNGYERAYAEAREHLYV